MITNTFLYMSKSFENDRKSIETDAIDLYFECITACSLNNEGVECTTMCMEVHLKQEN